MLSQIKLEAPPMGHEDPHSTEPQALLVLIKHQFHAPTCRVNVWNNLIFTLSTNLVHDFSVYLILGT
jgi:hypothetical protein